MHLASFGPVLVIAIHPDLSCVVKADVERDSSRCKLIDGASILCSLSLRVVEIRRDHDKLQRLFPSKIQLEIKRGQMHEYEGNRDIHLTTRCL